MIGLRLHGTFYAGWILMLLRLVHCALHRIVEVALAITCPIVPDQQSQPLHGFDWINVAMALSSRAAGNPAADRHTIF
jgi:hypothetical protein